MEKIFKTKVPIDYSSENKKGVFISNDVEEEKFTDIESMEKIASKILGGAVCIAAKTITKNISDAVTAFYNNGIHRIYILTSSEINDNAIYGRAYVRKLKFNQSGAVIINIIGKDDCNVWLSSSESFDEMINVTKKHGLILYQTFCSLFWNESDKEACMDNTFTKVGDSPFTYIPVNDSLSMPNEYSFDNEIYTISSENNPYLFLKSENIKKYNVNSEEHPAVVYKDPGSINKNIVTNFPSETYLSESNGHGFDLICNDETGILISSEADPGIVNWGFRLESRSVPKYKRMYDKKWVYRSSISLGDISEKDVRDYGNIGKKYHIHAINTTKDTYECSSAKTYLDDEAAFNEYLTNNPIIHHESVKMNYEITLKPPSLPRDASLHKANNEWKKTLEQWNKELDNIKAKCDNALKRLPNPNSAAAVAFNNRSSKIKEDVEELRIKSVKLASFTKVRQTEFDEERKKLTTRSQQLYYDCELESENDKERKKREKKIEELSRKIGLNQKEIEQLVNEQTVKNGKLAENNIEKQSIADRLKTSDDEIKIAQEDFNKAQEELKAANDKLISERKKGEVEFEKSDTDEYDPQDKQQKNEHEKHRTSFIDKILAPFRKKKEEAETNKNNKQEDLNIKKNKREGIKQELTNKESENKKIQKRLEEIDREKQNKESAIAGYNRDISEEKAKPKLTELSDELKKLYGIDEKKIPAIGFPDVELPEFEGAILHTFEEKSYISVPSNLPDSALENSVLLRDCERLKAKLCVRGD